MGLTQKMNSYLGISVTGSSFTNSSILLTDATLSSRISSSSSYLKFIRPSPSALALTPTSERIFIFHNQMMKVNMSSGYAYISVLNNALNFSSSSNISVVFFQNSMQKPSFSCLKFAILKLNGKLPGYVTNLLESNRKVGY